MEKTATFLYPAISISHFVDHLNFFFFTQALRGSSRSTWSRGTACESPSTFLGMQLSGFACWPRTTSSSSETWGSYQYRLKVKQQHTRDTPCPVLLQWNRGCTLDLCSKMFRFMFRGRCHKCGNGTKQGSRGQSERTNRCAWPDENGCELSRSTGSRYCQY